MSRPAIEIDNLNVEERLELIESLWESLVVDPDNVPVTDAQKNYWMKGSMRLSREMMLEPLGAK